MSRHIFFTSHKSFEISVQLGWDRPLSGYFLVVEKERISIPSDDEPDMHVECYLYSNLEDKDLFKSLGMCRDLSYFETKLRELRIKVPQQIFDNVRRDGESNMGNKFVVYRMENGMLVTEQKY